MDQLDLGSAEVQFRDHKQVYDSVRIIDGSVLRTASVYKQWLPFDHQSGRVNGDEKKFLAACEYDVIYHPGGSWVSVTRLESNGSLICKQLSRLGNYTWSDKQTAYQKLGDCLTLADAENLARRELAVLGMADQETIDNCVSQLRSSGETNFISLPIKKTSLIKRWRARRRPEYGKLLSSRTQPGRRCGVIFSFLIPAAPTSAVPGPDPGARESIEPNSHNGVVLKLEAGKLR